MTETTGISKLNLKKANRRQILNILRNNGPTSRVDIAKQMEITKAAVTIIVNEMIAEGIILEVGGENNRGGKNPRGRKKILIDINPLYKLTMGIVIDNGAIHCGLCTLKGDSVERHIIPIDGSMTATILTNAIREAYEKILYKNNITADMLTGTGICISEQYHSLLNIQKREDGSFDYSAFEELIPFVRKKVYGDLTCGLALAECDYSRLSRNLPKKLLLFRYDSRHSCAFCVNQEIFDGDIAHCSRVGELSVSAVNGTFGELCDAKAMLQKIRASYSREEYPYLWSESQGDPDEMARLLNDRSFEPQDPALIKYYRQTSDYCLTMMEQMGTFFRPDALILFRGEDCMGSFFSYLLRRVMPEGRERGGIIRESLFTLDNLYLAAAVLASRSFFIETGGY